MNPTTTKTFDIGVADGTFQAVVVPTRCQAALIQIGTGIVTDFTSYQDSPLGFHFSTTGNETNKDFINCVGSIEVSVDVTEGTTIGYVRAASGGQVSGAVVS